MFVVCNLIEEIFEGGKFRGSGMFSKMLGFAEIYFRGHKENYAEIYLADTFKIQVSCAFILVDQIWK